VSIPESTSRKRFRPYDPNAPLPLPVDLREWLPEDHLAYVISDVVDNTLDLSEIYRYYETVLRGQPPYDPRMMVKLLLYGYTVGIPSSRRIEKKTYEDIAFRVLTADQHPDHDTICDFRKVHLRILRTFLVQVLAVCQEDSPWPAPFPLPPPPATAHRRPCSEASWVLRGCPTSHARASPPCPHRVHGAGLAAIVARPDVGSPSSCAWSVRACLGSLTARSPTTPRASGVAGVAFRHPRARRHSGLSSVSRLNTLPAHPHWPTLRPCPCGHGRMAGAGVAR